jgi:CheY-like chemotaxis protein
VPVVEAAKPASDLSGHRLAIVAPPGMLRGELVRLAQRWGTQLIEVDDTNALQGVRWDIALVEVDEVLARTLVSPAAPALALPPARTFGLVPLSLSSDLRMALRAHFRLLINKPVHHDTLFSLLSGLHKAPVLATRPPVHFDLRVLLVEDNAVNQRLMQKVLTNLGCQWTGAENGRRAVEELKRAEGNFDVVLMDLHMPEVDGLTAIAEIRSGHAGLRAKTVWIAALTADARDDQRARASEAGANDYLVKPVRLPDIEAAFRRFREARKIIQ